jgi:alcohol dehydrogenase (NADP+)
LKVGTAATQGAGSFTISADGVDPNRVPKRLLYTGASMPALGLGTFGSDHSSADEVAGAVLGAVSVGYRHIDCASVYGNEPQIGEVLKTIFKAGIKREQLWITSKLWNDRHDEQDVVPACQKTLRDLQLDYLDLYLVHWPFPNYHAPGCDGDFRNPNAKPYIHSGYMKTWRQMEKLVNLGLVRHIGTSNMTIPKLRLLLDDAKTKPACNEMELHPHFQQPELLKYVVDHGMVPIAYSPIGSPRRPERDKTPADTVDIEDPVITRIAKRLDVHPAVVCVMWAVQCGFVPIPFSTRRENYLANLRGATDPRLSPDDLSAIAGIDRNCRLIKGQVFLWQEARSWEDLWDPTGEITPR